ncbi:FUSC family protein [Conexibacter stalactiti]|uniref:FUSC family protein n=1 Tax=Conexibacter stalactiti TaxID=1940611 RepID=A0ABU4HX44_9ACTN|nr:FUSC family protein [Conexibacter stalactiti]MDW5597897.1 FUSC family protein [Conexibacter stalactiti]MEC5038539.1 FUSC family protein [Conexibacter stalactiti]
MSSTRFAPLPAPRQFLALGPHAGAHRVALRAGLSVALPLLALYATGHLELSLFATFGAFTALYGRASDHQPRALMQLSAAAVLVACVTIGTAVAVSPARDWLILPVAAIVAAAAVAISDVARWHPPGALFPVFALTACAAVPGGAERIPLAAAVAAASALIAVAIGVAGLARPALRRRVRTPLTPTRAARAHPLPDMLRCATATLLAGLIPTLLGLGHPYWAMVGALAALSGSDATARLVRAGHRAAGTLLGLALAAVVLALPLPTLATILVVVALQYVAELLVGRNYALALVVVTPLALLMVELAHPVGSATLLHDRGVETLLGVAVGVAVTLLSPLSDRRPSAPPSPARSL